MRTVIIDGEVIMQERALTRLDERKVVADAKVAHRDLLQRIEGISF